MANVFLENIEGRRAEKRIGEWNKLAKEMGLDIEFYTDSVNDPLGFGRLSYGYRRCVGVYIRMPDDLKKLPETFCRKARLVAYKL